MSLLSRLQSGLRRFFLENVLLKLLSLGCAVGAWAWVQSAQVVQQRVRVRVNYDWPADLVRVEEAPKQLVVTVEGPQGLVRTLNPRRLLMRVDLSDGTEGVNAIDFTSRPILNLPQDLLVVQISPPEADVVLEPPMEKVVAIKPTVIGEPARGWTRKSVSFEPETVTITGPKSLVQRLSQVPTDVVDTSGIQADTTVAVPLMLGDVIRSAWQLPVSVTIDVEPLLAQRTFTAVALSPPPGWRAEPETVQVVLEGPVVELQELSSAQLALQATLPADAPPDQVRTLRYDARSGAGLTLLNKGSDAISVKEIVPTAIKLHPPKTEP